MRNVIARFSLLVLVGSLVTLTSCELPNSTIPCTDGVGERVKEIREVEAFDQMIVNLPGDVYLHQDANYRIEITAQDNLMEVLETSVTAEGVLNLLNNSCMSDYKTIRVDVYLPRLSLIEIQGSGDVYTDEAFDNGVSNMKVAIKGSGNVELNASADVVEIDIMGSGDVTLRASSGAINTNIEGSGDLLLRGSTDVHTLQIEGTGNINAFELMTKQTSITVNGSGDAEVYADERLNVDIRGSGNVFYKGNPILDVIITGTGEVMYVE